MKSLAKPTKIQQLSDHIDMRFKTINTQPDNPSTQQNKATKIKNKRNEIKERNEEYERKE